MPPMRATPSRLRDTPYRCRRFLQPPGLCHRRIRRQQRPADGRGVRSGYERLDLIGHRRLLRLSTGPCVYAMGGYSRELTSALSSVEMFDPGHPTVAWVARFSAHRIAKGVRFRWRMIETHGVAGFLVYAGEHRLTPRLIRPHRSRQYQVVLRWRGGGVFTLHMLTTNGSQTVVVAR